MNDVLQIPLFFLLGVFSWLFLEYILHRFLGHYTRGKNAFSAEHLRHHVETHYFAPTYKKLIAAVVVIGLSCTVFSYLMGLRIGCSFGFGLSIMYGVYEWAHRRLHTHGPANWYGRWARKHHFYHHFHNVNRNHGVTTPLWDIIFRTHETSEKIRVPRKLVLPWMLDESGNFSENVSGDYELRGGKAAPVK